MTTESESFDVRRCRVRVELASYDLDQSKRNLERRMTAGSDAVSQEDIEMYQSFVRSKQAILALAQIDLEEALYNQNGPNI